jgi:drug/metabolite transporter (DMT)-like permease
MAPAVGATPASARLGPGVAMLAAASFGFGTTFARLAYDGGSQPLTVVILRISAFVIFVGAALALLGRPMRPSRHALLGTLWMAVTLAMVSLGYQGSVAFIPVSLAALIFYCNPLMVGLIAVAAGRDQLTVVKAAALVAAFVGLALALGPGFASLDWRGIACALVAALGMALSITFGGAATRGEDALVMSLYTNVWLLMAMSAVAAWAGGTALPVTPLGIAGAAGLCVTYVTAYTLWYVALGMVRPVRLATLFNIEPVVTLFAAWMILGERLSAIQFLGAALVLGSVLAVTLSRPKQSNEPANVAAGPRSHAAEEPLRTL